MDTHIIKAFWKCGDQEIIDLACDRADLTQAERKTICLLLTNGKTEKEAAQIMDTSEEEINRVYYSACTKLLGICWVYCIAKTT